MVDTTFVPGTVVTSSWLNDVNDTVYGAISVFQFMTAAQISDARGDTSTGSDHTTAIQAAIQAALAGKKRLLIPSGQYTYTASGYAIDASAAGLIIEGEGLSQSVININANGVIFDVKSYFKKQFQCEGVGFNVPNPGANPNVTVFKFNYLSYFGASFRFFQCAFTGFTNCAIHGIRVTQSTIRENVIIGTSPYSATSGVLPLDDAGIRLWAADGTATAQEHQFSNLIDISSNWITNVKFGVDSWSSSETKVSNNNISNTWVGVSNKVNTALNPSSALVSNVSKGTTISGITLDENWFEDNALYHYSDADVDGAGANISGTLSDLYTTGSHQYLTPTSKIKPNCSLIESPPGINIRKYLAGTAYGDFEFFRTHIFDGASGNGLHHRLGTLETFSKPPIRAPGLSFGTDAFNGPADPTLTLNYYTEGIFTPTIGTDGAAPTVAYTVNTGTYTRIGNVVFFKVYIVTSSVSGGTGNLMIKGLPFAVASGDSAFTVTYKSVWTTHGPDIGQANVANSGFHLRYDNDIDMQSITLTHIAGGSGTNLAGSGFYFTTH